MNAMNGPHLFVFLLPIIVFTNSCSIYTAIKKH